MTFRGGGSGKPLAGQEVPRSAVSISCRKLPPAHSLDDELVHTCRTSQRNIFSFVFNFFYQSINYLKHVWFRMSQSKGNIIGKDGIADDFCNHPVLLQTK